METTKELFTKQYNNNEEMYYDNHGDEINKLPNLLESSSSATNMLSSDDNNIYCISDELTRTIKPEEPIDLTYTYSQKDNATDVSLPTVSTINCLPQKRGRKRKKNCEQENMQSKISGNASWHSAPLDFQVNAQNESEIMKAAETLFIKRTRTLYQWMYPNLPKQQIKLAVSASWKKLDNEERQYYISEVLMKFGCSKCTVAVNPQIGGIKELPPLPDETRFTQAICDLENPSSTLYDFGTMTSPLVAPPRRTRLGRPPGSKNKKQPQNHDLICYKISTNFQDDPELSRELEQFAINFDTFK